MSKLNPPPCDLCGLPVETPDYILHTSNGLKQFCCEGCHGIFQMLHEDEIIESGSAADLQNTD